MKNSGFAVSSRLVQERIDRRHMEIHNERVAAVTAIVDSSEPEYANRHKGFNAKKTEQEAEKMFEIEAENARIAQRLIYIETLDSTKILRPTTSRSTIFDKSGTFYSDVGGHQCIDHINHNATSNPGSLHYRGVSQSGSRSFQPAPPPGSSSSFQRYGGSRGASPMRSRRDSLADSAEFSASVALDSETGIAKRAPSRASSVSGSADFIRTSNPGNLYNMGGKPKPGSQPWTGQLHRSRPSTSDMDDMSESSFRSVSESSNLPPMTPVRIRGPSPGRLAQSMGDLPLSRGPSPGRLSLSTDSSPRGLPPKGIPSQKSVSNLGSHTSSPRPMTTASSQRAPPSQSPSKLGLEPSPLLAPPTPTQDEEGGLAPTLSEEPIVGGAAGLLRRNSMRRNSFDARQPGSQPGSQPSSQPGSKRVSICGDQPRYSTPPAMRSSYSGPDGLVMSARGSMSGSFTQMRRSLNGSVTGSFHPLDEHRHSTEIRQERIKSLYYSGGNLVQTGNTVTAVRRSKPFEGGPRSATASPARSRCASPALSRIASPTRSRIASPARSRVASTAGSRTGSVCGGPVILPEEERAISADQTADFLHHQVGHEQDRQ